MPGRNLEELNIEATLEHARGTVAYAQEVHRKAVEARARAAALRQEATHLRALSAEDDGTKAPRRGDPCA